MARIKSDMGSRACRTSHVPWGVLIVVQAGHGTDQERHGPSCMSRFAAIKSDIPCWEGRSSLEGRAPRTVLQLVLRLHERRSGRLELHGFIGLARGHSGGRATRTPREAGLLG